MANQGKVILVTGPVVDVKFPEGNIPPVYNALTITNPSIDDSENNLVLEVALHTGNNTVRAIAMDSTDGLYRGMVATDTGEQIMMPVGDNVLGRILNVSGAPVDEAGPVSTEKKILFTESSFIY